MAEQQQERRAPPRPPPPHSSSPSTSYASTSGVPPSVVQMEQTNIRTFRDLQAIHDNAYKLVDTGLQADERGDAQIAIDSYTQGLQLLNRALRVNCELLLECTSDQINQGKEMQMKFNKTKQQITFRLQSLQAEQAEASNQQALMEASAPPSYEEAMSEPSSPPAYDDDELTVLGESLMRREISSNHLASGAELFSIPDGVQIFFITPEGYVSAPSYPTSLHIVRLEDEPQTQGPNGESPPAFLHVGDWVYPLIPGTSPVLHTNYGAYLFPDVMATEPGSAVGLMVPDTLSLEEHQRFEDIIRSFSLYGVQSPELSPAYEEQPAPYPMAETVTAEETKRREEELEKEEEEAPQDTAGKIAHGIQTAADWLVWGVGKGAEKAGELIQKGAEKIRERSRPAEQPRKIDPKVQKGVIYARQATNGAVKVTGYIVNKLGEVTVALAKEIAPHVRKQGKKVIPKSLMKEGAKGKSTMDGVVEVAASGLKGFGTVYMGLETAAKSLGKSLANETVHIVKHKYGEEAGVFTENTMYSAGNVVMTAYNANHLGVKALAKRTAKETGKAVLEDMYASSSQSKTSTGSSNSSATSMKSPASGASSTGVDGAAKPTPSARNVNSGSDVDKTDKGGFGGTQIN